MEETFLTPVIEKLVELLADEVALLKGVHKEVKSVKDELEILQPFLKDAEAKSEKGEISEAAQIWLKQLREKADCIEDVVDEYLHLLPMCRRRCRHGFLGSLRKAAQIIKSLKPRHDIASEIRDIKESLREIKERGQCYGLRPFEQGSSRRGAASSTIRLSPLFIEKDELVGIESASTDLIAKLIEGASTRLIISLVGEGGIGKTTLAKNVHNDEVVKKHFELASAWITVSQPYNLTKVLMEMKRQLCKSGADCLVEENNTIEQLIECVRAYLQTKRYVIFLDDVWEENFWNEIKLALPDNKEGSRIIVTTRNPAVADSCKETPYDIVQNLDSWSHRLAWELFCKKAFKYEFEGNCPQELEQLSNEIVRKCHGLPLVIATIASLLSTKEKVESEWRKVLDDLNSKVKINPQLSRVQKILSLSYYDLPYSLRSCFLYFGIFPEDYSISDERLFRLWIAEGFIKAKVGVKTLEEVAEEYLSELTKRSVVVFDKLMAMGEGKWFRVHDLMRDVILSQTSDVCFCRTWDKNKSKSSVKDRRLIISGSTKGVLDNVESSVVRSVFLFDLDDDQFMTKSFIVNLLKKFKLLKVLHVENAPVDTLPKDLGKLFYLKYLSLRNTRVKLLPKSINKLRNLESLDIRDSLIGQLPKEINELPNLRHLLAYRYNYSTLDSFDYVHGVTIEEGFGGLDVLQTLTLVEADFGGASLMKELEKLTNLRWLGISKLTKEIGRALCASIDKMNDLKRLFLSSINESEVLDIQCISSPPHFLHDLLLTGRIEKIPEWILTLQNLRCLSLCSSRLIDGQAKCLKGLAKLEKLYLVDQAYEGELLHFEEGGFEKLKSLALQRLERLKVVKIDRGALPVLEHLSISLCEHLEEVHSIQHLTYVKHIVVNGKLVN